jgi:hypothetical protein
MGCFFKFHLIVGVEVSIVNALYSLRITDYLFKSYSWFQKKKRETKMLSLDFDHNSNVFIVRRFHTMEKL